MRTTSHHAQQSLHYVLDQAFRCYVRYFRAFTGMTACCLLPIALILVLRETVLRAAAVPFLLLAPIVLCLAIGAFTWVTRDIQRRQSSIPITLGLRRVRDLVITFSCASLLILGPTFFVGSCMVAVLLEDNSEGPGPALFIVLLPLLLIAVLTIPLLVFWFFLVLPVFLYEDCDPLAALGRSKALTQRAAARVLLIAGVTLFVYVSTQMPAVCLSLVFRQPAWVTGVAILLGLLIALPFHAVHTTYLYTYLVHTEHTPRE
jgi:hypothetical protein